MTEAERKEYMGEYNVIYYKDNKEKRDEYFKRYYIANREKINARSKERYKRKKAMKKEQEEQRRYALATSGGVCEVCGKPLIDGQPQAAHRIGNTKANREKYGAFVIDHRYNVGYTCSLKCNGALDISRNDGEAIKLIQKIYSAEAQKYGGAK